MKNLRTIIKVITGLACLLLLAMGALAELTTPAIIVSVVCLAWLSLVAFATLRREKKHGIR